MRKYLVKSIAILLLIVYLPVVLGGGECIGISIDIEKGIRLDFTHRCGKAHEELRTDFSTHVLESTHHSHSCRDFALYSGDGKFFKPAIHSANVSQNISCLLALPIQLTSPSADLTCVFSANYLKHSRSINPHTSGLSILII